MVQTLTAKLQHKAQFQQGLDQPVVARSAHFALHGAVQKQADPGVWCIGAVIPKRWAKRAVTRNAIRRQIYQAWSDWHDRLPFGTHVVRLRHAFAPAKFTSATSVHLRQAVRQELNQLFAQRAQS
ncbi:MAG: ribonuclease P protein component [Alphaproteobacteria bacterium]|nr:ribonuclease P protein component [Alphaproteobacteria bacterium]